MTSPRPASRVRYAVSGVLAALTGMSVAHLAAGLTVPSTSPVLSVGSTVIDLTPTPVKEFAVARFGTADKPILIGSVLIGVVALASLAGLAERRRRGLGVAGLLVLVALAGASVLTRPSATLIDLVPTVVAAVVGSAALWTATGESLPGIRSRVRSEHGGAPRAMSSRRGFVLLAGGLTVAAAGAAATGQWLATARTRIAEIVLPAAREAAAPFPQGLETTIDGITPLRTPTADFYRVDTRLTLPRIDLNSWRLTIDGDVDQSLSFSLPELLDLPMIERDISLTCVSNDVGGQYAGGARWLGVRLTDLLDRAGVGDTADQLLSTDVDGFRIGTPLKVATDGRDTMIAVGMNGEQLTAEHGYPARLVTPGLYGYVGATKWLSKLTLTTYAADQAYWTERDWATDAPIKIASRIDVPRALARIKPGPTKIAGIAWAQHRGVGTVQVSIDGGAWTDAELGPDVGVDYWRQWYVDWEATSGQHEVAVRAITQNGDVQTSARATPFPNGSSGWQKVVVRVD